MLVFKNNNLFRSSMSKISNSLIDNAEDLDIVMLTHNLNKVTIILWHQEVCKVITGMK